MSKRRGVLLCATGALGCIVGFQLGASEPRASTEVADAQESERETHSYRTPGQEGGLDVEVASTTPGAFSMSAKTLLRDQAAVIMSYELVTDRGSLVAKGKGLPQFVDARGATARADTAALPQGLGDGYYILRVSAMASDAKGAARNGLEEVYLSVEGGAVNRVTHKEFSTHSLVDLAQESK